MPPKFLQSVKTRIFYEFLKIVKSALFQNTTEQQNRLKKSGYSAIVTSFQAFNRLLVYDRERKTLWKVRKLVYTTLEARKLNLWRNVVEKAGSRPLFQPLY